MGALETPCVYVPRPRGDFRPFVYGLVDPAAPGHVRYVGMANVTGQRPYMHAKHARLGRTRLRHLMNWVRSIQAQGRGYSVLVLEELPAGASSKLVGFVEFSYIKALRGIGHDLTNLTDGGDGVINPCQETREKRRVAMLGNQYGKGVTHTMSPEGKESIRRARTGSVASEESKEKRRMSQLLRYQDPAERARTGEAVKAAVTAEQSAKKSAAMLGNQHLLGHVHTAESLALMSASHMGSKPTDQARANMRRAQVGHVVTEQTKAAISAAAKRRSVANALLTPRERTQKEIDRLNKVIANLRAKMEKENAR